MKFSLIAVVVATLQLSCRPEPVSQVAVVVPKSIAAPTATASPPVKHVDPHKEAPPTGDVYAKAFVAKETNEQERRWLQGRIKPVWEIAVNKAIMLYSRTKQRYKVVQDQRPNGVPAAVIFCLHYRESSNDFSCHLHEGSSLQHQTRYVPKGRLPRPDPPYRWEVSAEDAIYIVDKLQGDWSDVQWAFDKMEAYNGLGYKKRGVPSPYIESGTQYYSAGKYISDGRYSSTAIDQQLGCRAILIGLRNKGYKPFEKL